MGRALPEMSSASEDINLHNLHSQHLVMENAGQNARNDLAAFDWQLIDGDAQRGNSEGREEGRNKKEGDSLPINI